MATSDIAYNTFMGSKAIQMLLQDYKVRLLVVNPETKEITEWIEN
ncbi:MAG: hypothetical protein DYG89_19730 [Caldilinea sp. CFX5]|nr:hypothetical protein [Caldilinea sp. CFX5]